ncbi:MAG: hypothetical protein JO280_17285 [Mycobacteriaceae bacterium]|nr:hypothetical protein [Mycobacteriaceae bacterium]
MTSIAGVIHNPRFIHMCRVSALEDLYITEVTLILTDQPRADVTVVTLNNPARLNALSMAMVAQLLDTL